MIERIKELLAEIRKEIPHFGTGPLTLNDMVKTADRHKVKILIAHPLGHPLVHNNRGKAEGQILTQRDDLGNLVILLGPDIPLGSMPLIAWHELVHLLVHVPMIEKLGQDKAKKYWHKHGRECEAEADILATIGIHPTQKFRFNVECQETFLSEHEALLFKERVQIYAKYGI